MRHAIIVKIYQQGKAYQFATATDADNSAIFSVRGKNREGNWDERNSKIFSNWKIEHGKWNLPGRIHTIRVETKHQHPRPDPRFFLLQTKRGGEEEVLYQHHKKGCVCWETWLGKLTRITSSDQRRNKALPPAYPQRFIWNIYTFVSKEKKILHSLYMLFSFWIKVL